MTVLERKNWKNSESGILLSMTNTVDENFLKNCKTFCVLPWIHLHGWPDGKVFPCCIADSTMPVSYTNKNTILDVMNSDRYKEIRVAMLNDEPVKECSRCYELEDYGVTTLRQSQNNRQGMKNLHSVNATSNDGTIDHFNMRYMDIRFSNFCNFKCRSCGPSCSSLWAQEHIDNDGADHLNQYFGMKKVIISNNEENVFFSKLTHHLDEVEEVYFAGGEIIITEEHYQCLDYWIANGRTNIDLNYTSNFSTLKYKQKDLLAYWKHFKNVRVWASLDGMGKHAELIRKGTDWTRIEANIKRLREEAPNVKFSITPTISLWNIYEFPKYFDYLIDKGYIDSNPGSVTGPRFNLCTWPSFANIGILPQSEKDKLIKLYGEYRDKYSYMREFADGFTWIINALGQGKTSIEELSEFFKYNDKLDTRRSEKWSDIMLDLGQLRERLKV